MSRVLAKGWTKLMSKKRVEEHRFPTTEKEQGTSRWSFCTHNIFIIQQYKINQISHLAGSRVFPYFCRLPTYRTASRWPIPLQTPREAVEPNKSNLFLVGTLTWHRKGVIADSGKIIDYHVGIHEHGAHLSACWTKEGTQDKMERGRVWINSLTCDDNSSNPLRLYYVKQFVQTRPVILWVGDRALGSLPLPEVEQWWWYYNIDTSCSLISNELLHFHRLY